MSEAGTTLARDKVQVWDKCSCLSQALLGYLLWHWRNYLHIFQSGTRPEDRQKCKKMCALCVSIGFGELTNTFVFWIWTFIWPALEIHCCWQLSKSQIIFLHSSTKKVVLYFWVCVQQGHSFIFTTVLHADAISHGSYFICTGITFSVREYFLHHTFHDSRLSRATTRDTHFTGHSFHQTLTTFHVGMYRKTCEIRI